MKAHKVLTAPDKFRGTATALEIVSTVAEVVGQRGWIADSAPMADGGEGTLDIVEGELITTSVSGTLGSPIKANWRLAGELAVIEMAQASGHLPPGEVRDAIAASTRGTGELIAAAIEAGATKIVVGAGGSGTTDGGWGAVEALQPMLPLRGVELIVATDVRTLFIDCARIYGPQKGATPEDIPILEERLRSQIELYKEKFGVDVSSLPGAGAAGGLAGGLAAIGAQIVDGFSYFADLVDLERRVAESDLVVTGEGKLDFQSTQGKVVGGVIDLARRHDKSVLVIAGSIDLHGVEEEFLGESVKAVSLVDLFGPARALSDTLSCVQEVAREYLG